MHGTVMMFLFAVPIVEAVAVYLLPGMLGARDLPFPRLSAYAFWAYAIGGLAFFCTIFFGASPDGGWFMYPPLTSKEYSPGHRRRLVAAGHRLHRDLGHRRRHRADHRHPVHARAGHDAGADAGVRLGHAGDARCMIVFAFPAVIAGTTLLELERAFDWPFFIAERGGDPLLWQHLFWFFGHPEVYIIFLPAAGMVSMMVADAGRARRWSATAAVVAALVARRRRQLRAVGAPHVHRRPGQLCRCCWSRPPASRWRSRAAVQVFAWIATFWQGRVRLNAPTLFLLGFLFIFVLGGLTGVMVAVLPFDWQVHDTYFIVAHLHYVLIGGMVFPLFAGAVLLGAAGQRPPAVGARAGAGSSG